MAFILPDLQFPTEPQLARTATDRREQTLPSVRRALEKFKSQAVPNVLDEGEAAISPDEVLAGANGLGWSLVQNDPARDGLNERGAMTIEMEISTRSAVTLIGRVLACAPVLESTGETCAEILGTPWVDVIMRQIPGASDSPNTRGLSVIELTAYETEAAPRAVPRSAVDKQELADQASHVIRMQRSFTVPLAFPTSLRLTLQFTDGSLLLRMHLSQVRESLVEMRLKDFGTCMPMIKLRSGRQPFTSSVMRASFQRVL
jgi:hypothetical protein